MLLLPTYYPPAHKTRNQIIGGGDIGGGVGSFEWRLGIPPTQPPAVATPISSFVPAEVISTNAMNDTQTLFSSTDMTQIELGDVLITSTGEKLFVYQIEIPSSWFQAIRGVLGTTAASVPALETLYTTEYTEVLNDTLEDGSGVLSTISEADISVNYNNDTMDIVGAAKDRHISIWMDTNIPDGWSLIRMKVKQMRTSWTNQPHIGITKAAAPTGHMSNQTILDPDCYTVTLGGQGFIDKHLASVNSSLDTTSGSDYTSAIWDDVVLCVLVHNSVNEVWQGRKTKLYQGIDATDFHSVLKHVGLGHYTSSNASSTIRYKDLIVETIS